MLMHVPAGVSGAAVAIEASCIGGFGPENDGFELICTRREFGRDFTFDVTDAAVTG